MPEKTQMKWPKRGPTAVPGTLLAFQGRIQLGGGCPKKPTPKWWQ